MKYVALLLVVPALLGADWRYRIALRAHANSRFQPRLTDDLQKGTTVAPPAPDWIEPFPLDQKVVPAPLAEAIPWPTVTIHSIPGCVPCAKAKEDLKRAHIPFYEAKTNAPWMDEYGFPVITWKVNGTYWYWFGWSGLESFMAKLHESMKPKPEPKPPTPKKKIA